MHNTGFCIHRTLNIARGVNHIIKAEQSAHKGSFFSGAPPLYSALPVVGEDDHVSSIFPARSLLECLSLPGPAWSGAMNEVVSKYLDIDAQTQRCLVAKIEGLTSTTPRTLNSGLYANPPFREDVSVKKDETAKYNDPDTWPRNWTAAQIENLLKPFLVQGARPSYNALALLLNAGDVKSLQLLVRASVKEPPPKQVDLAGNLKEHLRHSIDAPAMVTQERTSHFDSLAKALSTQGMRKIAYCNSPRGSGKTQFLMSFIDTKCAKAMKCGRVIVRCCDIAGHEKRDPSRPPWLELAKHGASANGLCELIRTHVGSVTGCYQDPLHYRDPDTAYATWMSETANYFNIPEGEEHVDPLILLDTCELLAQREPHGKPQTMLESFCLAVPAPYGIVVVGCDATVDIVDASTTVTRIGPLLPLTASGHRDAVVSSWKSGGAHDAWWRTPLYHLAGGVPRLLRQAPMNQVQPRNPLMLEAFCSAFNQYAVLAKAQYPIPPSWFPQAYTCFLTSSTKAKVKGSDVIPVNPAWWDPQRALTYDEAATLSMGTYDPHTGRFMVPPITFGDAEVVMKQKVPILPSQLHPFTDANVVARFGKYAVTERGRLHDMPFLCAIHGRYCLVSWKHNTEWVSLAEVFEGAVHPDQAPLLERYEVNLAGGVKTLAKLHTVSPQHDATYCGETRSAHLCCRQKVKKGGGVVRAVPLLLCHDASTAQQLRWGDRQELVLSLASLPHGAEPRNMVLLDANALSSNGWLFPSH
ncbi:Bodo-specific multi-copy gene family, putative [Bodo saltans]|uniref:Bodo-specific multi-copy gene family, putative n=1 Tax=Bodo saltans TaxID=75058 RepID=A0A0S4IKX5_BODSA|nr:Bodo-specific multi-copy gene family, putative [Bodo saltans]|eukprot:CUE63850.1 Bodo-specific multi-copy gene family, putative [Bodo saltans]